jgi:hypothetical protein
VPTSPIAEGYQTLKECFMGLLEGKVALVTANRNPARAIGGVGRDCPGRALLVIRSGIYVDRQILVVDGGQSAT